VSELRNWIVVNTHPHKETAAIANLSNQGYGSYCPMVRKRVRHARRTRDVLRPLFPGYVFVELGERNDGWRPVLSTLGVRSLVRNGESPSRLDDGFVVGLRAREIDGAIVLPGVRFAAGQKVKITDGPFDGTIATILSLDEKDRLIVLMDLLNRPVRVHLEARQVSSA
jgi:transcriptional antiterminator RfaH